MEDFQGWRIDGEFEADIAIEIVLDVPGDAAPTVCELEPMDGDWTHEEITRALLISAAPKMLRAIRLVSEAIAQSNQVPPGFDAALDAIESVAAAFRGRA